jgi:hypothetical protein
MLMSLLVLRVLYVVFNRAAFRPAAQRPKQLAESTA